MINIEKQVAHWHNGAHEEWTVAVDIMDHGHVRHGLFFAHLALEKALKALVCLKTRALAPRTHNLVYLAEQASLSLDADRLNLLAKMNLFSMASRYPEALSPMPEPQEAKDLMKQAEEVFTWLIRQS
jgi:HEPN domain-containing protein